MMVEHILNMLARLEHDIANQILDMDITGCESKDLVEYAVIQASLKGQRGVVKQIVQTIKQLAYGQAEDAEADDNPQDSEK